MDEEVWRPIPGYEAAYDVSNLGRVRRFHNRTEFELMALTADPTGRKSVGLTLRRKKRKTVKVAILVALAFLGPRPQRRDVLHNDGDPSNDRLSNLRYGTKSANMQDMVNHGRGMHGTKCPFVKLSERDILEIRKLFGKYLLSEIAIMYGTSVPNLSAIKNGRTWKHLKE